MPPHRGQGLNHAINDAFNFVEAVKKIKASDGSQSSLIQAYSDEVAERGAKETLMSKESAYTSMSIDTLKESPWFKHGLRRMLEEKQQ
jgi:2-polyprenyl-6-methoxyphenol hydroxylase-like FAD-dependent oxidoreductase